MYVFYLLHGERVVRCTLSQDVRVKQIYQSSYILFNPYGHKGSEFAPIVIHVHLLLCILYREEKCENFTEHNRIIL